MIIIYVLTGGSFLALFVAGIQGYAGLDPLGIDHFAFSFITVIVYLLTEVLVIFFFVATGGSIKDYVHEGRAKPEYHQRALAIKRRVYPATLLNMLLVMTVFILGGAADTGSIPPWVHGGVYMGAMIHFVFTIRRQHTCFKENTSIVLAMTGRAPASPGRDG
ncbi:MAG: hypothetical protein ACE5HZ_00835 [Fidelibacterota bacterium]